MTALRAGVEKRIEKFFEDNPDEELTHAQVVVKFDANQFTARDAIKHLVACGFLETAHVIRRKERGPAK